MIVESVVAGVTLVTLGCLWLSEKVLHHVYEELPKNIYPFIPDDGPDGKCPLCDAYYNDRSAWCWLQAKKNYFEVKCRICGGTFNMKFKTEPIEDDDHE